MPYGNCYFYTNHSPLFRRLDAYFRSRGAPESKLETLRYRWIRQKGHREPPTPESPVKP